MNHDNLGLWRFRVQQSVVTKAKVPGLQYHGTYLGTVLIHRMVPTFSTPAVNLNDSIRGYPRCARQRLTAFDRRSELLTHCPSGSRYTLF